MQAAHSRSVQSASPKYVERIALEAFVVSAPVILARNADHQPMMGRRPNVTDSDQWAFAIGRSILAHARLEHAVTLLIRQCTSDALGLKMARLDLSIRLARFDELLQGCGLSAELGRSWRRICQRIEALRAKTRTVLAYGTPPPGPIEFAGNCLIVRASGGSRRESEALLTLPQIELAAEDIAAAKVEFVQIGTELLTHLVAQRRLLLSEGSAMPKILRRPRRPSRPNTEFPRQSDNPLPRGSRPRGGRPVGKSGA
jgi:hypothetical protein